MRYLLIVLVSFLSVAGCSIAAPDSSTPVAFNDPVFDVPALTSTPLNARVLKSEEEDGIVTEEVMFHSHKDGEKDIDIFAIFSYTKGAQKLPAFIWNQGGLAPASTYFTKLGARRGYAALCIDFPQQGYRSTGGYLINSSPDLGEIKADADPKKAPIYHGAVALLKAVSYLQSRPEVDKDRIGMAGSSWGGFYTTLMIGIDPRLKAGTSMFGSGGLHLGNIWWDARGQSATRDAAYRERWASTLDPAWRLQHRKTPMAWFTGTNDWFYWMPAVMHSHNLAAGPKHLTLLPNWDHGLNPSGDEQVFAWLDVHLKGAPAFLQVTPLRVEKKGKDTFARWSFSGPRKAVSADLILSYGEEGNWPRRHWSTLPAQVKNGMAEIKLPPSNLPYYISGAIVDDKGFRYSTPIVPVAPATFGNAKRAMIEYNGASMWGGFEKDQIQFLQGLAWPDPAVSTQAREGKQAASLKGKTLLPPLGFTTATPHRFCAWAKSDKATTITIDIGGDYDGKPQSQQKQFPVGANWSQVCLDFTPPKSLVAGTQATITVPEGASVLMDSVTFQPIWKNSK